MSRQFCAQEFAGEPSRALRIPLEFDDIVFSVITAHQLCLGTSAHSSNVFNRSSWGYGYVVTLMELQIAALCHCRRVASIRKTAVRMSRASR